MARLALALERSIEARLVPQFAAAGHEVVASLASASDIIESLTALGPDVVLVSATRRQLDQLLISACDRAGVRIIAFAASDVERRHAAYLGLYEVLDSDAEWPEIEEALAGVPVPQRTDRMPRGNTVPTGATIAVWGPAGAPGRTTVAITLAAEIAAAGYSVVLADADTHSGSVAPALGLLDEAPGFAAACRLTATDSLTIAEFERVAQRYPSPRGSFWVLTGLGRPTRWPELSAERVTKTLAAAQAWVDYVIVDTGFSLESDEEISSDLFAPRRNAATVAAIRAADHVVAVGVADPVGMSRFLRAHVDLVELTQGRPVSVIINKIRASALGAGPFAQVAATLERFAGLEAAAMIPWDVSGLDAAMLTGRTLTDAAPKSPARIALRRFVQAALVPQASRPVREGRRARARAEGRARREGRAGGEGRAGVEGRAGDEGRAGAEGRARGGRARGARASRRSQGAAPAEETRAPGTRQPAIGG